MRIASIVAALSSDLAALGALGDETTVGISQRLAIAMEGPIAARLLEALAGAAAELDRTMPTGRVELRLSGTDADLVFVEQASGAGAGEGAGPTEPEPEPEGGTDASARITLRLSATLKAVVESASARAGVSTNTWIVRALEQQARGSRSGPRAGRRLSGYGQS